MWVTNINGTSDNKCGCGSWLEHWKKVGGEGLPSYCAEKTCTRKPEVGAHVQKLNSADKAWYIVPFCQEHNGQTGKSIEIVDSVRLVSANVGDTCGKVFARYSY